MSKPINVYSIPELRQTLDEALPGIFARLNYKQHFRLIDVKLAFGYSIAVVAAISFLLDKKFNYDDVLIYQKLLVGLYTILSAVFWYFTKHVEKGITYVGINKDGEKLVVKTHFEKREPVYLIDLIKGGETKLSSGLPVNKVFNEAGYLQSDLLFQWLSEQLKTLDSKKCQ